MKKICDSKRSGRGADEVYQTHLWYYDLLLFTKDQEIPRESVNNLVENQEDGSGSEQETDNGDERTQETEHETQETEHRTEDSEHDESQQMEPVDDDVESLMSPPTRCLSRSSSTRDQNQLMNSSSLSSSATSKSSKRKKTKVNEQADEILTMVGERLHNNTTNNNDPIYLFGKHIAAKLRTLPKETRLYTEKLINDILFEAEMDNIDKNSKIVTSEHKPRNSVDTDSHATHGMVDVFPRNDPYLSYSNTATHSPIIQHQECQSSQTYSMTQLLNYSTRDQQALVISQSASAKSQSDASVSTFFGNYKPADDNNYYS